MIEYINNHTIDGDNFMFLIRKNRGGLINPSQDVVKICMLCERKLRHVLAINDNKISGEKNFLNVLIRQICAQLYEQTLFESLDDHMFDHSINQNHKMKLIKTAVEIYL